MFDPVDVQAEMEVTVRVRKAAAEALMEANEKLKSAEDAQRSLQLKLEAAQDLEQVRPFLETANRMAISLGTVNNQQRDEHACVFLSTLFSPCCSKSLPKATLVRPFLGGSLCLCGVLLCPLIYSDCIQHSC